MMEMSALIASEFGLHLPDSVPIYHIQYMASKAETKRNDRIRAAQEGKNYVG